MEDVKIKKNRSKKAARTIAVTYINTLQIAFFNILEHVKTRRILTILHPKHLPRIQVLLVAFQDIVVEAAR